MRDKQIIIDGVDVSECIYLYSRWPNSLPHEACGLFHSDSPYDNDNRYLCKYNPDCYFKQLARKAQECEDLKEKYEALKLENQEGYEIVAELKHECEELSNKIKNEIQNTVEMERLAKSYGQDLMIYKQNKDIEVNSLKDDVIFYLKLIKKIEIYCDEQNLKYDTTACEILDIINKAKDGE